MHMKFANRDESAWERGELAYAAGDTLGQAVSKAAQAGYRPGSNGYAAFITAYSRMVRSGKPLQSPPIENDDSLVTSAVVLSPDFQRTGT